MQAWSDPALYRKLSVPFESAEALEEQTNAFVAELRVLREKYKIPDVYVCAKAGYLLPDGTETTVMLHTGYGNQLEWESLVAYALGQVQVDRQQLVQTLVAGGGYSRKRGEKP